jgi:putative peptidoglycan lipid II flippase
LVAWALGLYALGLPAHSVVEIVVRAFYAMHDTRTPVLVGIGAMGLNIVLSLTLLAGFRARGWEPYGGLALGNSLAVTVEMAVLVSLMRSRRRLAGLEGGRLARSLARVGLSSAVMGAAVGGVAWLLDGTGAYVAGGAAALAGITVYGGLSLLLGAAEPRAVWDLVRTAGRRRQGPPVASTPGETVIGS